MESNLETVVGLLADAFGGEPEVNGAELGVDGGARMMAALLADLVGDHDVEKALGQWMERALSV